MVVFATANVSNLQLVSKTFVSKVREYTWLICFISDSAVSALCDTTGVLTRL